jgi:hypothetical protein
MTVTETDTKAKSKSDYLNDLSNLGFKSIASKIRNGWNQGCLCDYFMSLLIDNRGGRQGFPDDVYMAIMKLYTLYAFEHQKIDRWSRTFFTD